MDAKWQYGEEGRWWRSSLQLLPCRRCSLDWYLWPFLSPFYTIFLSPSPLKPCWYFTCLIMMKHVPFSPNLSAVAWYDTFYVMISVTFERQTGLSFCSLKFLGMGRQKPISNWIPNGYGLRLFYLLDNEATRPVLTQPLHHCMKRFT
jgi:hypothetical protein